MKNIFYLLLSTILFACSSTNEIKINKVIKQNISEEGYFINYESNGKCLLNGNKNVIAIEKNTYLININHMPFTILKTEQNKQIEEINYKQKYNKFLLDYFKANNYESKNLFINDTDFITQIYIKNVDLKTINNLNCIQLKVQNIMDKDYLIEYKVIESDDIHQKNVLMSGATMTGLFQPTIAEVSTMYKDKIVGNSLFFNSTFFIESNNKIYQRFFVVINGEGLALTKEYKEQESEQSYNVGQYNFLLKIN